MSTVARGARGISAHGPPHTGMGDFLIDFRPQDQRRLDSAARLLQFYDDLRVERFEPPEFGLLLTSADDAGLWGSYQSTDEPVLVALCGRVALEEEQWEGARRVSGSGGLACKAIHTLYRRGGLAELEKLSGHFVLLLHDRTRGQFHLLTDRAGLMPAFAWRSGDGASVYASHPDALALAVGEDRNWDRTSLAEFILTDKVSFPFTYYQKIQALDHASVTTISLSPGPPKREAVRRYDTFRFKPVDRAGEEELVEQFVLAFRGSLARRTLPCLGPAAVALSGGLDSRTILCAAPDRQRLLTFCCHNEENLEFRIAAAIAQAAGVKFHPFRRDFDYYGDHAEMGVRISGGMGSIGCNHFLGIRSRLQELGVRTLLTGCYCDYVFKGLGLNKRESPWTGHEELEPFAEQYYTAHFEADTELAASVRARLHQLFPPALRRDRSESAVLAVEQKRVFPLCYEADNVQRLVPQRVMGWFVPVGDNQLLDVYLRMPLRLKLNRALFTRMAMRVCGEAITRIPDANTGAPMNASPLERAVRSGAMAVRNRMGRLKRSMATQGSWPNWHYYLQHSERLRGLWLRPNPEAWEFFRAVLGKDRFTLDLRAYGGNKLNLFLRLFTLRLWFDQRS